MINTQQKYNSIYKGVIIQNDDPSQSGRVKVFVPLIHTSLLTFSDKEYNKNINFGVFGKNINKQNKDQVDLTEFMEVLKQKLPWANVLQPIVGETGNAKFNSASTLSTPSDSNDYESSIAINSESELGGGAGELYGDGNVSSIWASSAAAGGNVSSPSATSFNYNKKHNSSKGTFAVPSVNTQVWVIFLEGNPQVPLIVGAAPSTNDWQQNVYPSAYPGSYENKSKSKAPSTADETIYRNATVNNSGAMTSVTNNSTGNQSKHEIHISGTSNSFASDGSTSSFVTADSNKMVMGSNFSEIKGSNNQYTEGENTSIVRGDRIKRVGSLNVAAAQGEKATLKNIDQYKALFETKRTAGGGVFNSLQQSKSGQGTTCPACSSGKQRPTISGKALGEQLDSIIDINLSDLIPGFEIPSFPIEGLNISNTAYPPPEECKVCKGTGISPSSMGGQFPPEEKKQEIGKMYVDSAPALASFEQSIGEGGNDLTEVTKNMVISVGCAYNDMDSIRVDPEGKFFNSAVAIGKEGPYSKQDTSPLIEPKHVDDLSGGTFTLIANNKAAFIVGAGGIQFETPGLMKLYGAITSVTGEQVNISSSNEINLGGGQRLHMEAKILSLKGTGGYVQVDSNLSVDKNLVVQGGACIGGNLHLLNVTAPMTLQPTEELVESFGTTNDKARRIIGYLEMGTILQLTVPSGVIVNDPSDQSQIGVLKSNQVIAYTVTQDTPLYSMTNSNSKPDKRSVRIYAHRHWFRNLPLTLTGSTSEVYEAAAAALSQNTPQAPTPPKNGKTGPNPDKEFNSEKNYDDNFDDKSGTAKFGNA
jgi:hypothetical protein